MSSARNGLNFLKQVVKARTEAKTFDNVLQGVGITFRNKFGIFCIDLYDTFELTRGDPPTSLQSDNSIVRQSYWQHNYDAHRISNSFSFLSNSLFRYRLLDFLV